MISFAIGFALGFAAGVYRVELAALARRAGAAAADKYRAWRAPK